MAGERSNQGENTTDGYYFQLYTLLYCIEHLMRHKDRFLNFEIGSGIKGYGALDDIVLHVTLADSTVVTNLLQVKHSNQMIHEHYLCYNDRKSVLKYFDTFITLKMNKLIPLEQLDQLIIWTNMSIAGNVKNWFEKYDPTEGKQDVLEDSKILPYHRFQFVEHEYKNISFLFHTRMKLVYEIVDGLFNEQKWKQESAAKSYFIEMAKQIFEGNETDKKFKDEFIKGTDELLEETDRFRRCFKVAMERKFEREKIKPAFLMEKLNSDEYKKYFKLNFDTNFKVHWEAWKNEEQDLEEFRKRFVLYVQVPQVKSLKTHLMKQDSNFTPVSELLVECACQKMINKEQFENLISLVKLRRCMDLDPYAELLFDDSSNPLSTVVENFLAGQTTTCLLVKANQDVYCTVSRLIKLVKNNFAPLSDRYLVLNSKNFYKNLPKLRTILKGPKENSLIESGLKCIIIAAVPRDKSQDIENILSASGVKTILVGDQLDNGFVDEFDISTLHSDCKDIINNREICLSELQAASAMEIFEDELFKKENYRLALGLYRQHTIRINRHELQLDKHFSVRKLKQNNTQIDQSTTGSELQTDLPSTVFDLMCRKENNPIVISDQAGMGKSTELINIAVKMREMYNDRLVVFLDCQHALRHYCKNKDFTYVVCQTINITGETEEAVVRKIIELGKMILLLDGIDEVSDKCRSSLKAMLETIANTKLFKLVLATRPHRSDLIQTIFPSSIPCQLEPFSKSDQIKYLMSFWKINELADENDRTRIKDNAQKLIEKFHYMFNNDRSIIGIPMQTYMIAVIYKESIMLKDFEPPKPYRIGYVYKRFVELKFEDSIKHFDLNIQAQEDAMRTRKKCFVPNHMAVAQNIYANGPENELKQLCKHLQTYGLVRLHPSVGFIHHTYFEYFLSLYFITQATSANQQCISFMRQNLCPSRDSIVSKFIDFHIDPREPETNNSTTDCLPNDSEPPPATRFHPDKTRGIELYFLHHCSEIERYTRIRNSFNLSVFNVFEVMYDSLPTDTKSALKFSFGSKPEPNFINLKLLGGNQVLQLLSILLKKNPENFVRLYLTDFGDGDEDFLEVACRKPFVQVLDWLVDDLIPNLKCEERTALNSYVDHRFDKYLQLIVKHNNAQFLQNAIQRAKYIWPETSAVKCFLLKRPVLKVFLNTVELRSDTKPLKDDQRVEMVRQMHDLYHWAFDGQFIASDDCRKTIADLRNDAIKSAFNDTFLSL